VFCVSLAGAVLRRRERRLGAREQRGRKRGRVMGGPRMTYFEVWLEAGGFHGGDEVGEFFALGPG
jgi:hypothetical protein